MKQSYTYPAIFHFETDTGLIGIQFPDLPGCLPCADNMETALHHAKEAMGLHLFGMIEDGDPIPEPSPVESITVEDNEQVFLIEATVKDVLGQA